MATLITGAGLVGTSFAQQALKRGESLVFFDPMPRDNFLKAKLGDGDYQVLRKDVRDLPALISAIQDHDIDTVVHSAGLIGGRVAESIYTGIQINVMGTTNVAEAVRLTGVKRLVHISTFGVYDWRRETNQPIAEDFPRGSGRPYPNSKIAKEVLLEAYQGQFKFELIFIRPANVFGLGHFWGGSGGGEKMQILMECGLRGEVARVPQDQTMTNEYIYGKDVGRAIDLATTVPMPKKNMFNIGNGELTTFDQLSDIAKSLLPKLDIEVSPGDPPHSHSQPLDISAAKEHLGWEPEYSLEAGFKDYIDDLKAVGADKAPVAFG